MGERINRSKPLLEQVNLKKKEIELVKSSSPVVLIGGLSGVGKTTLITKMLEISNEFTIPQQVTTREVRSDDSTKRTVSVDEFQIMLQNEEFFHGGQTFGNYYGTLQSSVMDAVNSKKIPLIDFPIARVGELKDKHQNLDFFMIYILPSTVEDWYCRLKKLNRNSFTRLKDCLREINSLDSCEDVNEIIVNEDGKSDEVALKIITTVKEFFQ